MENFRFSPIPGATAGHLAIVQPEPVHNPGFDALHAGLTTFAACIRDGKSYTTAEQVLHGVEVFEAIVESSRISKPVAIG